MTDVAPFAQAKEAHKEDILSRPNVVGVGVGYRETAGILTGDVAVIVLVERKVTPAALSTEALVPREVGGLRTDVREVGEIRAQQSRTDRWRPAPGGTSIGHYRISAGTFGCVVRDRATGARLILSNNHVLANSNDAAPGDPIIQPGGADGGVEPQDVIARLERFIPINYNTAPGTCGVAAVVSHLANAVAILLGSQHRLQPYQLDQQASNLVDAAVARPLDDASILDEILEIGEPAGTTDAALGMPVRKSGRTTGFTTGAITVVDATVSVSYGLGRTARFENQIITGPMSQGGDSGSLLVAGDTQEAVGLLFAGSEQTTIHSPIGLVLDYLEVDL
ncbi:MAG: hypothetical protein R3248_04630 [Candidatus Promineifilaceae bacterium]|nr:hypothetical protein [Candidatus Promineifilaceae bacterium]